MRFGLVCSNIGSYADPRNVIRLAQVAEAAGWDSLLMWDHLAWLWNGAPADPWVALAAAGARTNRIVLGTAVTPVPRRRPQVLATQVATLDELTGGGRVILGAGIGGNRREFEAFGEEFDPARLARLLDEGLEQIRELWSGALGPREIPVWIGGNSRSARQRAARWDGWIPDSTSLTEMTMAPAEIAEPGLSEIAVMGYSAPGDGELHASYEQAGATWWLESLHDARAPFDELLARVGARP